MTTARAPITLNAVCEYALAMRAICYSWTYLALFGIAFSSCDQGGPFLEPVWSSAFAGVGHRLRQRRLCPSESAAAVIMARCS